MKKRIRGTRVEEYQRGPTLSEEKGREDGGRDSVKEGVQEGL